MKMDSYAQFIQEWAKKAWDLDRDFIGTMSGGIDPPKHMIDCTVVGNSTVEIRYDYPETAGLSDVRYHVTNSHRIRSDEFMFTDEGKIIMNGKEVYKFAVSTVPSYVEKCIEASGMTSEEIDYLIPHQANQRIIESIQNRLKYTDDKVISNIKYYGNTSAASIPIALVEGVEQGKIKLGSTAVLCGFGAGMTWGAAVVRLRKGIC